MPIIKISFAVMFIYLALHFIHTAERHGITAKNPTEFAVFMCIIFVGLVGLAKVLK